MKKGKYKILILSDLKHATDTILNNSIELAKIIDGDIEFFHVIKPTEVIDRESQLSAVRRINEQSVIIDKKIKKLLEPLYQDHKLKVNYKYAFGNVKDEIQNRIKSSKPDIIVLGKRKSKLLNFIGDSVTDFVINDFDGPIMIASDENALISNKELSLGIFHDIEASIDKSLTENLINFSEAPIKTFKIGESSKLKAASVIARDRKIVEYVFEDSPSAIKTISNYASKNSINLLCIDRKSMNQGKTNYTRDLINKVNVSLLVT